MSIFELLFKKGEFTCVGSSFETKLTGIESLKDSEFFSINPLKNSRKDLNVIEFRNFLFEMDNLPLDQQLLIIQKSTVPLTSVVYSGSKSYHVIVSLETSLNLEAHTSDSVQKYKHTWVQISHYLAKKWGISQKEFDSACQNPSRFSRFPGHLRSNGVIQSQVSIGRLWTSEDLQNATQDSRVSFGGKILNPEHKNFFPMSEQELDLKFPDELKARLKYPKSWAKGEAGNYPELLKLVLWMIDSSGADLNSIRSYLIKKVFPILIGMGYPEHKLHKPINDAYRMKGL